MVDYLGLKVRHVDSTDTGGSSYLIHVAHAAQAIAAGKCRVALDHARRPAALGGLERHPAAQLRRRVAGRAVRSALRRRDREHVRDVRDAAHARVRHDERAARLDQGRRFASCAAQSARDAARGGHRGGRGRLAGDRRSAAPPRLLRRERRRRRARRRASRDRARPEAAAGPADRRGGIGQRAVRRQGRPDLLRRGVVRPGCLRGGRHDPVRHQVRVDLRQLHDHRAHPARGPRLLRAKARAAGSWPTAT